jgi:hypothetical protein
MQIEMIDYSNPPPGHTLEADRDEHGDIEWDGLHETEVAALSAAWAHYKAEHDPPGLLVDELDPGWSFYVMMDSTRASLWSSSLPSPASYPVLAVGGPFSGRPEARAAAWAWHDRRHALARDVADQLGEPDSATALLSKMLPWTDAECEEVEAYAALPFPRSIDMPAPLQRILLAEGSRTC